MQSPNNHVLNSRVLITDDNESILQVIQAGLNLSCRNGAEPLPFAPDYAYNGASALQKYQSAREAGSGYALLILDYHMPGMDGITVAQQVRDGGDTQTRIVLFTAFFDVLQTEAIKAADIEQICQKTDVICNVRTWIERLLEEPRSLKEPR